MKLNQSFKAITSATLITAILVSCGGDGGSSSDGGNNGDGTTKITLSAWDVDTALPYIDPMLKAFNEKHPNIEVEIINIPASDYTNKLNIDLNGGAAADVMLIKDGDTVFSYNKKNQLADLSSFIEKDGVNLSVYNGLAENFSYDNKQVGLPVRTDYYILYYNKDIFDAQGVDYPTNDMTWGEFEDLAKEVTYGEGQNKVYGAYFHTWQALVQNWSVQDGKNTIMGPDYDFMADTYNMVLSMQNDDKTIPDYATVKTASIHYSSIFQNSQTAMVPMGTWFLAQMIGAVEKGETDINWGIATIPHPESSEAGYTVGSTTPIAINESSENKEAAWELVKFITSDEGAEILADYGQFPGCINDDLLDKIVSGDGMPEGSKEALTVSNISLDRPSVENVNEVNQMLGEEHSLIMLGEVSVEEGLATMTERSKEIQGQ